MAGKPAATPSSGAALQGETHTADEESHSRERVGPLALERLSKDDGRALLLYKSIERQRT